MSSYKYNDMIEIKKGHANYKAYHKHALNDCNYLQLDYEEHPKLDKSDLEPLMNILVKTVEDYIVENKKSHFELVEHSSSVHVLYEGKLVAKIWHDGLANSQIRNSRGAWRVAEEFVNYMEDNTDKIKMPQIKEVCGSLPYAVTNGCLATASFKHKSDADKYMDDFVYTKYGQRIYDTCGKVALKNSKESGNTIELFGDCMCFKDMDLKAILYHLREYIDTYIEEA